MSMAQWAKLVMQSGSRQNLTNSRIEASMLLNKGKLVIPCFLPPWETVNVAEVWFARVPVCSDIKRGGHRSASENGQDSTCLHRTTNVVFVLKRLGKLRLLKYSELCYSCGLKSKGREML